MKNQILRLLSKSLLVFATTGLLGACSDDETVAMLPTLPSNSSANVRAVYHDGSISESYDWTFSYSNRRLSKAVGTYRNPDSDKDKTHSYTSKISYGANSVSIKNTNSENGTITLNGENLIGEIKSSDKTYKFHYQDGRLYHWERIYRGTSYGHADELRTSATIEYLDGDFKSITYKKEDEVVRVVTFNPDTQLNNNGLLPETVSEELGLIGIEHLYYAGLLGKGTRHLVKSVSAEYPKSPSLNTTTDFSYSHKDGNTILCTYLYRGQASSARYEY